MGQTGKTLIGTVGKSAVKEVAQDALVGAASSKAGSLVMNLTGDANLSRLAGLGTGILSGSKTGKALNSIDNAVSSSVKTLNHIDDVADVTKAFDGVADSAKPIKSLSELMSPEDAAKYNTFLKNGSSASFTQSELKAFQKVDEAIALNKVNYDDVLQLRRNNVSIDEPARLDEIEVTFNYNSKYDESEFARQLADQQNGMNKLTVQEYLDNRQKYIEQGRSTESNAAQQVARENAYLDKVNKLRKSGLSIEEAEEQARVWLETKAALHNPDQVAGGRADNVDGVGDKGINSSIGSQWKYRIDAVDEQIKKLTEYMTDAERNSTYLNVKLTY